MENKQHVIYNIGCQSSRRPETQDIQGEGGHHRRRRTNHRYQFPHQSTASNPIQKIAMDDDEIM